MQNIQRFYNPKETQYLTHSFHPYPNKFIPQIARTLIEEYTNENNLILDPFCGSGTVLVEANLLKRNAIGIDLNPLACLISRVKTTKLDISTLKQTQIRLLEEFKEKIKKKDTLYDFITEINPNIPTFPKREKWFKKNVLKDLSIFKQIINQIKNKQIRDFYLVAFSKTIKEVSNASSIYRLTLSNKDKYVSEFHVSHKLERTISAMINEINIYNQKSNNNLIQIIEMDSKLLINNQKVDFILTNPPSFNLDFSRSFKIYFWWLYENVNITDLDKTIIGTKKGDSKIILSNIDLIDELIDKIKETREGIAFSKYIQDMGVIFQNLYNILKEGRYCCIKITDFILYKNKIKIAEIFIELAKRVGFKFEKRVQRTIPKKAFIFSKEDRTEEYLIFGKI